MPKRKPGRPARDLEPEETDEVFYFDDFERSEHDMLPLLTEPEDRQVWAGFFSSVMCGAAASSEGLLVNPAIAAMQADEMLREYRARCDAGSK